MKYEEKGVAGRSRVAHGRVGSLLAGLGHTWQGWVTSDSYAEVAEDTESTEECSWRLVQRPAQRCAVSDCYNKEEMNTAESAYTILRAFA